MINFTARYRILAYRKAMEVCPEQEEGFIKGAMWAFQELRKVEKTRKLIDEIEQTDKAFAEVQKRLNNG